jgi:acylphosphatase
MSEVRARLHIIGTVQGVGFRYFTARTAQQHNVSGWVRNRPDGTVDAVLEGPEASVRQVIDACRQGPSHARVDEVLLEWDDYRGEFTEFAVKS